MRLADKSTVVFEVRLWSREHYRTGERGQVRKKYYDVFDGVIVRKGQKKNKHFHSAGDLLIAMEKEYWRVIKK